VPEPLLWITAANVLYLVSYSVRNILWLRILAGLAALLLIPYYLMQASPLFDAIAWNALFASINAFWVVRLALEQRPVQLTPDESVLRAIAFPSLSTREASKLFALGRWDVVAPGDSLVRHDLELSRLSVILSGTADVRFRGQVVGTLEDGQFVGAIDRNARQLDLDVVVRREARVICWPRETLDAFFRSRPDTALALERALGYELRRIINNAMPHLQKEAEESPSFSLLKPYKTCRPLPMPSRACQSGKLAMPCDDPREKASTFHWTQVN
jgi:CRP-like cAMP-binding protein